MPLYKNKYRTTSIRWDKWDYRNPGAYFVTICTKNRISYFGECIDKKMHLNDVGEIIDKYWKEIPQHFPNVILDEFVVMPNHLHGIIIINARLDDEMKPVDTLQCNVSTIDSNEKNKFMSKISPKPGSLSTILRSFKSICTKEINKQFPEMVFGWQSRFYDRVIRDKMEFERIKQYIMNNPQNWKSDKLFENK